MLAKFADDDRIEQMNAQKRRMKQLEHRRAVETLIEDRRKQFEAEKAAEMDEMEQERQRQAMRQQIIEEERQKLLKEHAEKLLGFMPKVGSHFKNLAVALNLIIQPLDHDPFREYYETQRIYLCSMNSSRQTFNPDKWTSLMKRTGNLSEMQGKLNS